MDKIRAFFVDRDKRTVLILILSGLSLIVSFFDIGHLPVDAAWVAIILCGYPILKGAVLGLVRSFDIKADVLVSIALIASVIIGETFAAGEVAFIMIIGALLEDLTVAKARAGIEKLVHLSPRTARVVANGAETTIPADQVQVGDILRVLAGETIAVDGEIVCGQSSIDQSVMTGESLPVDKGTGDPVYSGTVNQFGTFEMRATKVGENSSLQRMIRLVQSADASRARIVKTADRWATWIVAIALSAAAITWLATGEIIRAVTILVVFCPCALVLATPTAIMAGIGNATRHGILIREGDALERLARITRIAFDKTGTLTHGRPAVAAIESLETDDDTLLALAASAELRSEHPLGKAIVAHYRSSAETRPPEPKDFQMLAGRGVRATVAENAVLAGNAQLLQEHAVPIPQTMLDRANTYRNEGCTIIYVALDDRAAGFIALADTLRADAVEMIRSIERLGVKSVLLTGDNERAACHIGQITGVDDVHADCLPEDKMAAIDRYHEQGDKICMVGDGVNDAPALKKAYAGIAMGHVGSDIAMDAADVVLVGDEIESIPHLLALSKRTMSTIRLNMILSMTLNFAAILLAIAGILNPVLGALVHNAGSVLVVVNSSLLLRWREKRNHASSFFSKEMENDHDPDVKTETEKKETYGCCDR